MISFRFHLVSLTAVFLALALGIVLGYTVLNEATVSSLESRIKVVRRQKDEARNELSIWSKFAQDSENAVTAGQLDGVRVLIVAPEGTDSGTLDDLDRALANAGAIDAGRLMLADKWRDEGPTTRVAIAGALGIVGPISTEAVTATAAERLAAEMAEGGGATLPALVAANLVRLDAGDPAATPGENARLVFVTDAPPSGFTEPLARAVGQRMPARVLVTDASSDDEFDQSLVALLRDDPGEARLSTVDHVQSSRGPRCGDPRVAGVCPRRGGQLRRQRFRRGPSHSRQRMIAPAQAGRASRDAAAVSIWNLASRVTGILRVVTLGGALGATRLGDTYQGSNQVSNVLFELLAAGTLSAILVPGLVARMSGHDVAAARSFAGVVLGRSLAVLLPLVVVAAALARPVSRLLFAGNGGASHDAQVRLGAFLLLFVLPQLLLYAWGAVATAVLHAAGRFAAASLAPVANNVVVAAGLGLFWYRGAHGLALSHEDRWLLGATALGGVVAMAAVPAIAAWRAGLGVVPRLGSAAEITGVGRDAAWGSLALLPAQVVAFASLLVAARVSGGVAAYQIAFTFFLLPHALIGHPTTTVLYPRLARLAVDGPSAPMRVLAGSGLELLVGMLVIAAALTAALAPWLVRIVAVGELAVTDGRRLTATVLGWLALGLPAYGGFLLLTRVSYAVGDVRRPAQAALWGAAIAGVVLLAATTPNDTASIVALVALAHTAMVIVAAAVLLNYARAAVWIELRVRHLGRFLVAATVAGVAARLVADGGGTNPSRLAAAVVVMGAAALGAGVYVGILYVLGLRRLPRLDIGA